jgi:hypothetical protein
LPVSVKDMCVERQGPPDVFESRWLMVELIHGHLVDVVTRLVEVSRGA